MAEREFSVWQFGNLCNFPKPSIPLTSHSHQSGVGRWESRQDFNFSRALFSFSPNYLRCFSMCTAMNVNVCTVINHLNNYCISSLSMMSDFSPYLRLWPFRTTIRTSAFRQNVVRARLFYAYWHLKQQRLQPCVSVCSASECCQGWKEAGPPKSTQTFSPLDLKKMSWMPSECVNVPHSLCIWNNNKRIMRRLVVVGAKMGFKCGNMQQRLFLLQMN